MSDSSKLPPRSSHSGTNNNDAGGGGGYVKVQYKSGSTVFGPNNDGTKAPWSYKGGQSSSRGGSKARRVGSKASRDARRRTHAMAVSRAGGKGAVVVRANDEHVNEAAEAAVAALDRSLTAGAGGRGLGVGKGGANANGMGEFLGQRVLFAVDLDCFYAQVTMRERPELKKVPLGITQKYLVVCVSMCVRVNVYG